MPLFAATFALIAGFIFFGVVEVAFVLAAFAAVAATLAAVLRFVAWSKRRPESPEVEPTDSEETP